MWEIVHCDTGSGDWWECSRCYNTHKQYINSKDVEKSVQCCSCAGIDPNCASRAARFETLI